jgi:hypothetical protein
MDWNKLTSCLRSSLDGVFILTAQLTAASAGNRLELKLLSFLFTGRLL